MIPKIIHHCWLSGDQYPELIQKCVATWKEKLPEYEFVLWDAKKSMIEETPWVKQAFETKKYAFAADYLRLYAVYHHGGIYLDMDIEVIKDFDPLLHLPYFIGSEGDGIIEAGVFGAEKGTAWLGDCLHHYNQRSFIKEDGSYDMLTLPRIMMKQIQEHHEIIELKNPDIQKLSYTSREKQLSMFPKDYFCAKNQGTGVIEKTDRTFSIHHFAMSWISKKHTFLPNFKRKLIGMFGVSTINALIRTFKLKELKALFANRK